MHLNCFVIQFEENRQKLFPLQLGIILESQSHEDYHWEMRHGLFRETLIKTSIRWALKWRIL